MYFTPVSNHLRLAFAKRSSCSPVQLKSSLHRSCVFFNSDLMSCETAKKHHQFRYTPKKECCPFSILKRTKNSSRGTTLGIRILEYGFATSTIKICSSPDPVAQLPRPVYSSSHQIINNQCRQLYINQYTWLYQPPFPLTAEY